MPTQTVLTAETLNAGATGSNPWKKTFDYWSNAGSTATNVLYTQNGVVIEGTNRDNSMNIINAPVSIANGDKFEITFCLPLRAADGGSPEGYVSKFALELYQAGKTVATAWLWCDGYGADKDYISADFGINLGVSGTGQITGVHIPKRAAEEGGGVKFGFDTTNGWYCEVGGADAVYQAVADAAGVTDDAKQKYRTALTEISGITDITRVRGTQKWNTDVSKTRVCLKELNGQNLCLDAENQLTLTNSFNVMQLQVKSGTQFRAKQTYSFEMVGIPDPTVAVASRNKTTIDPTVWTYANPNASMMGNIGWDNGKIQLKLATKDGTVVSSKVYSGTWGASNQSAINFTIPQAGEYTLSAIFYTAKGYTTVRTLDVVAEAIPYIEAENFAKTTYYAGDEITVPSAKLMNKEGTAQIEGATVTSAVTFGGNAVAVTEGKFTAEHTGKYTVTYTTENEGLTITSVKEVTVKEDTVKSIEIQTQPAKTAYYAGESFDKAGMAVNAVYESGKREAIADYEVPETPLTAGQTSVIVTYGAFRIPVTVSVSAAPTVQIENTLNKVYYVGQKITVPGAKLVDENKQEITGVAVTYAVTVGQDNVTVTGDGFTVERTGEYKIAYSANHNGRVYTAEITLTVREDEITGIKITSPPAKLSYTVGAKFDKTGMVVKAVYASLKEVEITDFEVTDKNLELTDTEIRVSYAGHSATVAVRVHEPVYIDVKNKPEKTYYVGTEVTLPEAKLLNDANGGAEIVGAEISVEVMFGGNPVTIADGKFTVENAGEYTIVYTAEHNGTSYEYSVEFTGIVDRVIEIRISVQPTKTTYIEGDTFDADGLVVTAVFESGREATVTDYQYKQVAFTTKDNAVVISYGGCSTSVQIKVEPIGGASAVKPPEGTKKDNSGLVIGLSVAAAVLVLTGAGIAVAFVIKKKR